MQPPNQPPWPAGQGYPQQGSPQQQQGYPVLGACGYACDQGDQRSCKRIDEDMVELCRIDNKMCVEFCKIEDEPKMKAACKAAVK